MPHERRGLRLFGHPVHAMLSAFPLALLSTSSLWELVGFVTRSLPWWQFAFWSLALGLAAAVPTVGAGLFDYVSLAAEDPAERTASLHMLVMLTGASSAGCGLIWLRPEAAPAGQGALLALICGCLGTLVLLGGGWLGGELVFKHGVGGG